MIQNLMSYLLGATGSLQKGTISSCDTSRLVVSKLDDGWMLVERDQQQQHAAGGGGRSEAAYVDSLYVTDDEANRIDADAPGKATEEHLLLEAPPTMLTRTSSASSLPSCNTMEESWFVTPPPCFISTEPIHMETSPLENLLIEHPSMSVYHSHNNHRNCGQTGGTSADRDKSNTGATVVAAAPKKKKKKAARSATRCAAGEAVLPSRINKILDQQIRQVTKTKQAQKVQIQKSCQGLKRNCLERNNKARDINNRNHRQRRGERSQGATPSYANNNRKC